MRVEVQSTVTRT